MEEHSPTPKRVVVISDLHLGGSQSAMMSRPGRLVSFLNGLPGQLRADERLELVIAGDFVDFLCVEPWSRWTPEPSAARTKLDQTMNHPQFSPIFDSLRALVASGCDVTILLGNHDLELALPAVQDAFWKRLGTGPHRVLFLTDGRAYRVGGLLIEHGNRYDGANANDWDCLRTIASAQSRGEDPPVSLRVSAGSEIVENVVNPLKGDYPFLDLIQPQNELVAMLLLAFEPSLIWDWGKIAWILKGRRLQEENPRGDQPRRPYQVAASPLDEPDEELQAAFGKAYDDLRHPPRQVSHGDWLRVYLENRKDSLSEILRRGDHAPADRLYKIRLILCRLLLDDRSFQLDGPTGPYGGAAERLIASGDGVQAVIMGHTHLPRKVRMGKGWYLNTGTWIDRIHVPGQALQDGADEALETFLKDLLDDHRPDCPATYADTRISPQGNIEEIELRPER
jgi:UDP-2,3-diacylglucosamine pyrophosphatase LpxH